MKKYLPDTNCLMTLRIIITFIAVVLVVLVRYFITVRLLIILISTIICSTAFFLMFAYLPMFIGSIRYTVTENEIIKSSGVIMKIHQSVQHSSIQYTNVITTPFSQYTGLNFIVCFVYGGHINLLFLNHRDADEILKIIDGKNGEGAEDNVS